MQEIFLLRPVYVTLRVYRRKCVFEKFQILYSSLLLYQNQIVKVSYDFMFVKLAPAHYAKTLNVVLKIARNLIDFVIRSDRI